VVTGDLVCTIITRGKHSNTVFSFFHISIIGVSNGSKIQIGLLVASQSSWAAVARSLGMLICDRSPYRSSLSTSHDFLATRTHFDASTWAMDTDIGTELFAGYENDFNLIIADISSKLQALQDQDGEGRKAALGAAQRAVEEAEEIVLDPELCSCSSKTDHGYR
jgi:hypothetical protein